MLVATSGARLLGNMLTGKCVLAATREQLEPKKVH